MICLERAHTGVRHASYSIETNRTFVTVQATTQYGAVESDFSHSNDMDR
jgi:hypothetical protein